MITGIPIEQHRPAWQGEMAGAISDPAELLRLLGLSESPPEILADGAGFRLKVPMSYMRRMRQGDPDDPLLRQVLPLTAESEAIPGFISDPVGDQEAMAVPGLLHKYRGRALLVATGACAVHCRYCFRRHFPYAEANPSAAHWDAALDYLRKQADIHEIILSGGDPLALPDHRLGKLIKELEDIPQLSRLRIHTRLPVVIPQRVDSDLLTWLEQTRFKTVVVLHINHAQEIDTVLAQALDRLRGTGAQLLNQAVLLRGINDTTEAQTMLSEALFEAGVLPYYLHLLDRVQGSAHFEVPESRAIELHETLRRELPGYLLPRLVREIGGMAYKSPV